MNSALILFLFHHFIQPKLISFFISFYDKNDNKVNNNKRLTIVNEPKKIW